MIPRVLRSIVEFVHDHVYVWWYRYIVERDRARIATEIADRLRAYPTASVAALERRLRLQSNLVRALGPRLDRSFRLVAAALSIAFAVALWKLPLFSTTVVATVDADTVRFRLSADWTGDARLPLAAPVSLDGLAELRSPALFENIQSPASDTRLDLPITAGDVSLEQLRLERGTSIELERLGPALNIYLTGPARGRLALHGWIQGAVQIRESRRVIKRRMLEVPEQIEFAAGRGSFAPLMLPARPDGQWVIHGMKVDAVTFSKESSSDPARSSFKSSIASGKVSLYDVNESFDLAGLDALTLQNFAGTVTELRVDPAGSMKVKIKGTATRVLRGIDETSTRDMTPSLLKYLYHQRSDALLALGIPWLWAILASLRRVIFP